MWNEFEVFLLVFIYRILCDIIIVLCLNMLYVFFDMWILLCYVILIKGVGNMVVLIVDYCVLWIVYNIVYRKFFVFINM